MQGSTGKGPTQMRRLQRKFQRDKAQAKGLCDLILAGNIADLERELNKETPVFIPGEKSRHRPPDKDSFPVQGRYIRKPKDQIHTEVRKNPHRDARGARKRRLYDNAEDAIADAEISIREHSFSKKARSDVVCVEAGGPNPPTITFFNGLIRHCQGCHQLFKKQSFSPPKDFVFKRLAFRPLYDQKSDSMYLSKVATPVFFHMKLDCLKKFSKTVSKEEVTITENVLTCLSPNHQKYLAKLGFLEIAIKNYKKENNLK